MAKDEVSDIHFLPVTLTEKDRELVLCSNLGDGLYEKWKARENCLSYMDPVCVACGFVCKGNEVVAHI